MFQLSFHFLNIGTSFFLLNIEMRWKEEQWTIRTDVLLRKHFMLMKIRGLDMHQTLVTVT